MKSVNQYIIENHNFLNFGELNIFVMQVVVVMNSCPLMLMSAVINDLQSLAPCQFLVGGPLLNMS